MDKKKLNKKGSVRQHFIPQFYLRNFGDVIYCYDKKNMIKFKTNPENIAVKSDFYGGEYEEFPSLEQEFSKIENSHSQAIKSLIEKKNYYSLNHMEKLGVCEFLGFQYLRGEQQRTHIKSMTDATLDTMFHKIIPKDLKVALSEDNIIAFQLNTIKDFRKFAVFFFNMRFIVFENHTSIPFWSSDNPLAKQNEYDKHPFGTLGVLNRGIEIHVPITPTLSIIACDPTVFEHEPETKDLCVKQTVIRENFLQLRSSSRFVYSNTDRFHIIKSMLSNNPHYRKDQGKFEYFKKKTGKNQMLISAERNDRWDTSDGELMGELDIWMTQKEIEKIQNDKDLEL